MTLDLLRGGLGDKKPDSAFRPKQLAEGVEHETEHTRSKPIAKEIAKDHLSEDPGYYTRLKTMEKAAACLSLLLSRRNK